MRHATSTCILRAIAAGLVSIVAFGGCAQAPTPPAQEEAILFDGMGPHRMPVTTSSREAQAFFDQGLTWAYAFNHDEAIRSFQAAADLDPGCAMAWWGIALCHGPHINNPVVPPERRAAAWEALEKARSVAAGATPVERALIRALGARYTEDVEADRAPFDRAYADAMVAVRKLHPNDSDVAALTAEALMDLQPWDLWTKDGQPKGRAEEIVATIEDALRLDPDHPLAIHLYIHAVEASPHPERAVEPANRLRTLVPAAGHLVHMPAHIDVRVGRWDLASAANVSAVAADAAYRARRPNQGFYRVYMAHNHHFLAYASMMEGRYEVALAAAREMMSSIPPEFIKDQGPLVDPVAAIELQVLTRFGKWDELLATAQPASSLPITRAMWRFARGSALAAKGDVAGAEKELQELRAATGRVPEGAMMSINPAADVLAIADLVLDGEIAFRKGEIDRAVSLLRQGATREDALTYMEPPEWIQPVRHALGAVLVVSGRGSEAVDVYREDLQHWPENGWSLLGLESALRAAGHEAEAELVLARFRRAWARADTAIDVSCLCARRALAGD